MERFSLDNNLSYAGSCRLPANDWGNNLNYYYSEDWQHGFVHFDGTYLWHPGHVYRQTVGKLTLPGQLSTSHVYNDLPVCTHISWHEAPSAFFIPNASGSALHGIAPYSGTHVVSVCKGHYDANPSGYFLGVMPLADGGTYYGPWNFGNYTANKAGGGLFQCPSWLVDEIGKQYICGTFGGSIVSAGNQGPSAFAFDVDIGTPAQTAIPYVTLLQHQSTGYAKPWAGSFLGLSDMRYAIYDVMDGNMTALKSGDAACLAMSAVWYQGELHYKGDAIDLGTCTFNPATNYAVFDNSHPGVTVGNHDIIWFTAVSGSAPAWMPGTGYTHPYWVRNATPSGCQLQYGAKQYGTPYSTSVPVATITEAGTGSYKVWWDKYGVLPEGQWRDDGPITLYDRSWILAYSIDDLKAVQQGIVAPDAVQPYSWWNPGEFTIRQSNCRYASQRKQACLYTISATDSKFILVEYRQTLPVIHVFDIV